MLSAGMPCFVVKRAVRKAEAVRQKTGNPIEWSAAPNVRSFPISTPPPEQAPRTLIRRRSPGCAHSAVAAASAGTVPVSIPRGYPPGGSTPSTRMLI